MTDSEEVSPDEYFDSDVTPRERAIFEGAITLGALYHQFVGTPVRDEEALERAIKESALTHPYIEEAEVKVAGASEGQKPPFDYPELSGKMLEIRLVAEFEEARSELEMRRVPELDYPLMYVKGISGPE